ncbi:MAG: hypothetical protein IMF01_04400 [Proteobacteria bacterium]|nr:hypothetical protein [Pseudomonadota bacterium]
MFAITYCKGFHITFPNGLTLSTQFGSGNYCDNHDIEIGVKTQKVKSQNVEIAIWDKEGAWLTKQTYEEKFNKEIGDDVAGYVEIEEWLEIVDWCREYKQEKVIKRESEE